MNNLTTTQAVIEDVVNAQKSFLDGVVESAKKFTSGSDRTPLRAGFDATESILLAGIKAQTSLANALTSTLTNSESVPPMAVNATKRVQGIAQKVYGFEEKLVKNTFATLDRYIPANGESLFGGAFQSPVQTVLDLTKKAFEFPVNLVKKYTAKAEVAATEAADKTEAAVKKTEGVVKDAAAKVEKKTAK